MEKIVIMNNTYVKGDKVNKVFKKSYGIGQSRKKKLFKVLGFKDKVIFNSLKKRVRGSFSFLLNSLPNEINIGLKSHNEEKLQNLFAMKSYRGLRKKRGLPVRGQRTRTNGRQAKKGKKD